MSGSSTHTAMEYGLPSANKGTGEEMKEDLLCRVIVLGRMSQPSDGIVEHYANEEN